MYSNRARQGGASALRSALVAAAGLAVACGAESARSSVGGAPAAMVGAGAPDAQVRIGSPEAGLIERDASPAVVSCPTARVELLESSTIAVADGVRWVWSRHHYVYREGMLIGSEIVWPWILPGAERAVVGHAYVLLTGGPTLRLAVDAYAWAGTYHRAALISQGRQVFVSDEGSSPRLVATLPRAASLPTGGEKLAQPPRAVLVGDDVVWIGEDGTVAETSLTTGATHDLVLVSGPSALAASARLVAVRTATGLKVLARAAAANAVDVELPAAASDVALRSDMVLVAAGSRILSYDSSGVAGPQVSFPAETVATSLAVDTDAVVRGLRCSVHVLTTTGRSSEVVAVAWPPSGG